MMSHFIGLLTPVELEVPLAKSLLFDTHYRVNIGDVTSPQLYAVTEIHPTSSP